MTPEENFMAREMIKYKVTLEQMVEFVRGGTRTAKDLAEAFQCTTQSIYNRMRDVCDRYPEVKAVQLPVQGRGRPTTAWTVEASNGSP